MFSAPSREERQLERQLRAEINQLRSETTRYRALYENEIIKVNRGRGQAPCVTMPISTRSPVTVPKRPPRRVMTRSVQTVQTEDMWSPSRARPQAALPARSPPVQAPVERETVGAQTVGPTSRSVGVEASIPQADPQQAVTIRTQAGHIEDLEATLARLREQRAALQGESDGRGRATQQMAEDLEAERRTKARLRLELTSSTAASEGLRTELELAHRDAERAVAGRVVAERSLADAQRRAAGAEADRDGAQQVVDRLKAQAAADAEHHATLSSQLRQELHVAQARLRQATALQTEGTATVQDLRGEAQQLREALKVARGALGAAEAERDDWKNRCAAMESRLSNESNLESEVDRLKSSIQWKNDELEQRARRIVALEKAFSQASDAACELRRQVEQIQHQQAQTQAPPVREIEMNDDDSFDAVLARELAVMREAYEAKLRAAEGRGRELVMRHAAALHDLQMTFDQERAVMQGQLRVARRRAGDVA